MTVSILQQWQASASLPGFGALPSPACQSLPLQIVNAPGDWLIAICAWLQYPFAAPMSVSVADDQHNWWEPLGAPSGDSSSAGAVRIAAWAAPAAKAGQNGITNVMLAPTAPTPALAMIVLDVAGMLPWYQLAAIITGYSPAAASLPLTVPSPPGGVNSFAVHAAATDSSLSAVSFSGTGWTPLTGTATINGSDHSGDLELAAQWKVINGAKAGTWNASPVCDIAGIGVAVVVQAAAPQRSNPNWPVIITEAGIGSGPQTPPSQINWVGISSRSLAFTAAQGASWLLGGLQAGQGAISLDNPDVAALPPGAGVLAGIDSGTPLRVRGIWPPAASPHNVAWNGYLWKAAHGQDEGLRGQLQATLTDTWGYAGLNLQAPLRSTILAAAPYGYWPLADPAGAPAAGNLAPAGPGALVNRLSKQGTGGSNAVFGASAPVPLPGDSSSTVWQQTLGSGSANSTNGYGRCLNIALPQPLDISGGASVECWFQLTATFGSLNWNPIIWVLKDGRGPVLILNIDQATGHLQLGSWSAAGAFSSVALYGSTVWYPSSNLIYCMVSFDQNGYTVYGDLAGTIASGSFASPLRGSVSLLSFAGQADRSGTGGMWSGYLAQPAVYPYKLPVNTWLTSRHAGYNALLDLNESASQRIERIMQLGGVTGRRAILPETSPDIDVMASAADIGGSPTAMVNPAGQLVATPPVQGQPAATSLQNVATSTLPAFLTVAPTGDMFYLAKQYAYNQGPVWVLGDGPNEIPVLPGLVFPWDPADVANDIQITQEDSQVITVPGAMGTALNGQPSGLQYGDQSYQATGYLQADITSGYSAGPGLNDLANWIAMARAAPHLRAQLTVSASAHPAAWPFVLGASAGDMVTINSRPPTAPAGTVISVTARIIQIQPRTLAFGPASVDGSVGVVLGYAPEANVLTADDPVRGLLNGVNCLGW